MNKYNKQLEYVKKIIDKVHPFPYAYYDKEKFYNDIENLKKLDIKDENKLRMELMKLLAKLKDSHTHININITTLFDIRMINNSFYIIGDFKNKNSKFLYKKIIRINDTEIDDVILKISKYIAYDNKSWLDAYLELYMLSEELLLYEEIITKEKFNILLDDKTIINCYEEKKKKYVIDGIPYYDYKISDDILYIKYGLCSEEAEKFLDNILQDVDMNNIKKLIIDLRGNTGGNSKYFSSFINSIKNKKYKFKSVVITDKFTFSSGTIALANMLEYGAIHIGEDPGAYKNNFGFVDSFKIPNTNIIFGVSNSFFRLENFNYVRYQKKDMKLFSKDDICCFKKISPSVKISNNLNDYKNFDDKVLDYAYKLLN